MKAGCQVKICGITSIEDARLAAGAGADFIGVVVEIGFSPRSLTVEEAKAVFASAPVPAVALVFEMKPERIEHMVLKLKPFAVQFISPEGPDLAGRLKRLQPRLNIWQSLHLPAKAGSSGVSFDEREVLRRVRQCREAGVDAVLFDTAAVLNGVTRLGGTGQTSNWEVAGRLVKASPLPAFLAGGINPANVRQAVEKVRPYGIDLCSGVEKSPGKKCPVKLKALMESLRQAGGTGNV
ncbi:phosphoribosylanthranilate isomerase [Pelotomaculum thermopropionicum SI]|uniref:N-(5'-phosphoribosyl)anthranilate isomerase n=1 Tax=Pelotomaculum thermopropionicum (strain DSM 13744 / JCM 10971 / SI) TaxID=370438 RepID=A5D4M0_PELTS|nr:phosphoribosylanthranilate isomerase [Pelotomaculum thermopropionicum SI]